VPDRPGFPRLKGKLQFGQVEGSHGTPTTNGPSLRSNGDLPQIGHESERENRARMSIGIMYIKGSNPKNQDATVNPTDTENSGTINLTLKIIRRYLA
jgi:hypothetical protein